MPFVSLDGFHQAGDFVVSRSGKGLYEVCRVIGVEEEDDGRTYTKLTLPVATCRTQDAAEKQAIAYANGKPLSASTIAEIAHYYKDRGYYFKE